MPDSNPLPAEAVTFESESRSGLVSIVVVCYDDLDLLKRLIPDIEAQTYGPVELICVLNAGDTASKEYLADHEITVLDPGENLWYSGGNDRGAEAARGEYLFILNPDTQLEPNTIDELVRAAEREQDAGVLIPKVLSSDGSTVDSVGKRISKGGWFGRIGVGEVDRGQYDRPTEVAAFDGAAFLVRRDIVEKVGLFDRRFEHYQETNDFALRLYRSGWQMLTIPRSVVYHDGGGSFEGPSDRSNTTLYYGPRNDLFTLAKHYNRLYALLVLPIHLLWPVRNAVSFVFNGEGEKAAAQLRGLADGILFALKHLTGGMSLRQQLALITAYPCEHGSSSNWHDSS